MIENGNGTLPHRFLHRKQVTTNRGYDQDLDPNDMSITAVVSDYALENSFACVVQQRPPSNKMFSRRREARAVQ